MRIAQSGYVAASGRLGLHVVRNARPGRELTAAEVHHYASPAGALCPEAESYRRENWRKVKKQFRRIDTARRLELPHYYGMLWIKILKRDGSDADLGLVSMRVVTNNGVAFIVDAFQNLVELEIMKFHGIGTGTTAEAAADAALVTELTTQYNPDSTRATGTLAEGASGNIYRTVATNNVDASVAITEHGIFSQAATGGGVLLDRSVFAAVNLASGDSIQTTYELTLNSGG